MEADYPIRIASDESRFRAQAGNMTTADFRYLEFGWEITYPSADSPVFQLLIFRLGRDDPKDYVFSRNVSLDWLVQGEGYLLRGQFDTDDRVFDVNMVTPTEEEIRFILMTWLFSDEGIYMGDPDIEICADCEELLIFCEEDHRYCDDCNEQRPEAQTYTYEVTDSRGNYDYVRLCHVCEDAGTELGDLGYWECEDCEQVHHEDNVYWRDVIGRGESRLCQGCADEYYWCEGCERLADYEHMQSDEYGDINYCGDCYQGDARDLGIMEWDYRPPVVFHPPLPENPFKPLYIGIEFELNWPGYMTDAEEWIEGLNRFGDLLYAKEDSSIIEGFEVVTHPMSPDWALENFPFHTFEEAIDGGADPRHTSTGMHIHMDRTAFTTAQMWKFLQVHKKLSELCGKAGGRGTDNSYARFDNADHLETDMMYIARRKGKAFQNSDRYTAVNLINDATIELRYMDGGIRPENIKKNIQWVKALYDFTDHINVADVKAGALDDHSYLLGWITDETKYPALAPFMKANVWMTAKLPDREMAVV